MPIAPLSSGLQLHADATSPGVGRFVIERPLSAGGFAITYLARDQQFDDRCVIKELAIDQLMVRSGTNMVPLPDREDDVAIWVQKVQKEAQVLHRLRTSGVVPIRATWRENGTAYFAMDFIDGIELPAEPTAGAGWATWETVARKFLTALGAIHAAGLVHGDIKPANVLVDRAGNPVIIDFGTARSAEDAKKTKLTTLAMTPGYCPPELAVRDRAKEMGPWSDLYSWALTVMGLVIRHGGIDGAPLDTSARTALAKHGHSDAGIGGETAVALRAAGVPESWVQALMACVALEPSARPKSAEEVAARIDAAPAKAKPARYAAIESQSASAPVAAAQSPSDANASLRASPLLAAPADNPKNRAALLVVGGLVAAAAAAFFFIGNQPATSTWNGSSYGSGVASACTAGFHLEGGLCASDTRSCNPLPATATAGTQLWTGSSYGACTISSCAAGYTLTANSCQLIIGDCSNQTNGSQVVISQVFGGGGNGGSVYRNDFIELHNRGTTSVKMNGWSVQYASSAGTSWASTPLGNLTIAAGGYLLIQEATGAGGTTNLPTPDVTGTIAMSATAGKVILVSSTRAAGRIECPTGSTIRDHLSYGSGTACDGTPALPLSAARAAKRNESCSSPAFDDTNKNSADFTVVAPAPRNRATPASSCSCTGP